MQEELDFEKLLAEIQKTPIVSFPQIINYIPQKPPIVMVDRIFRGNNKSILTGLYITNENIFAKNGKFTESGLIENIAQSAAAGIGLQYVTKFEPVPLGFIAGIKNLNIYFLPEANTDIYTVIEEVMEVFGITIIKGTVFSDKGIIANCEMKVLVRDVYLS